jgi:hypothetical protein
VAKCCKHSLHKSLFLTLSSLCSGDFFCLLEGLAVSRVMLLRASRCYTYKRARFPQYSLLPTLGLTFFTGLLRRGLGDPRLLRLLLVFPRPSDHHVQCCLASRRALTLFSFWDSCFPFGISVASFRAGSVTLPPLMSTIVPTSVTSEPAMTPVLAALSQLMLPPPSWLPPGPVAWPRPAPCSPPTCSMPNWSHLPPVHVHSLEAPTLLSAGCWMNPGASKPSSRTI